MKYHRELCELKSKQDTVKALHNELTLNENEKKILFGEDDE